MTGRRAATGRPRARVARAERRRALLERRWRTAGSAWIELLVAWDYFRAVLKASPDRGRASDLARAAAGDLVRRADELAGEERGAA